METREKSHNWPSSQDDYISYWSFSQIRIIPIFFRESKFILIGGILKERKLQSTVWFLKACKMGTYIGIRKCRMPFRSLLKGENHLVSSTCRNYDIEQDLPQAFGCTFFDIRKRLRWIALPY